MGMGAYSGRTEPPHLFGTYGGVSHAEYNKIVKEELKMLIKKNSKNPIKTISSAQMSEFIQNLQNGLDHAGRPNAKIKAFNDGIAAQRATYIKGGQGRGFRTPQTPEQWTKQGKSYLAGPGAKRVIKGAMIASAISGWVVFDSQQALAVAADSQHFKAAIQAMSEGDMVGAERHLFGEGNAYQSNCFFADLVNNKLEKIALLFHDWYYKQTKGFDNRLDHPLMRYPESGK